MDIEEKNIKKALITGITGQDGSYLAELLLSKGYKIHGLVRRASTFNRRRIEHIYVDPHIKDTKISLYYADLSEGGQLAHLIYDIRPDEIYHLAAQSHVRVSFDMSEYTGNVTGLGTTRILEAIRQSGIKTKLYNASSSEMFGNISAPQNEETPFHPKSPYAAAKVYAHWMVRNYREGYGLFAVNGIFFNHESPRRGESFVSKKITRSVARIKYGLENELYLGNLDAKRDWGFAPEYVEAIWEILQLDKPEDFAIGTGESHSVKEFVEEAFSYVGLDWQRYVKIDPQYFRPTETDNLIADARKSREKLNWQPKISFSEVVKIMVDADIRELGKKPIGEGDRILKEKFPHKWWKGD